MDDLDGKTRRFSGDEDRLLMRLRGEGMTFAAIGHLMNRPQSSVGNHFRRLQRKSGDRPPLLSRRVEVADPDHDLDPVETFVYRSPDGEVRCLGGCGKTFHSPDRMRIRICPTCKNSEERRGCSYAEFSLRL